MYDLIYSLFSDVVEDPVMTCLESLDDCAEFLWGNKCKLIHYYDKSINEKSQVQNPVKNISCFDLFLVSN